MSLPFNADMASTFHCDCTLMHEKMHDDFICAQSEFCPVKGLPVFTDKEMTNHATLLCNKLTVNI